GGGGAGGALPIVPEAGRVCAPASIVHAYEPPLIPVAFHVQETAVPDPRPRATTAPPVSRTVTAHEAGAESLAVKRTGPPRPPVTSGAYSLGSPVAATARARSGSFAYSAAPGQLVGPVSRCPEITRSFTGRPRASSGLPPDLHVSVLSGSTWATSSRHASSCTSARVAAGEMLAVE